MLLEGRSELLGFVHVIQRLLLSLCQRAIFRLQFAASHHWKATCWTQITAEKTG